MAWFQKDLKEEFIVASSFTASCSYILMQTVDMKDVLNSTPCGLETDTIEGFLYASDYEHGVDLHVTGVYDPLLHRCVPVLVSILFGRDTTNVESIEKNKVIAW